MTTTNAYPRSYTPANPDPGLAYAVLNVYRDYETGELHDFIVSQPTLANSGLVAEVTSIPGRGWVGWPEITITGRVRAIRTALLALMGEDTDVWQHIRRSEDGTLWSE